MKRRRERPKVGWVGYYGEDRSFRLEEKDRKQLLDIVGLEAHPAWATAMWEQLERSLSVYPTMTRAWDHGPRPVHRRASLNQLLERLLRFHADAEWLRDFLLGPDPSHWDLTVSRARFHFLNDGHPLAERLDQWSTDKDLGHLEEAARLARKSLDGRESRHRPTHRARHRVIGKLSCIFDFFFREQLDVEGRPFDSQKLKLEFVFQALRAANVPVQMPRVARGADTPAKSSFARQLPGRCESCWDAGRLAAQIMDGAGADENVILSSTRTWWDGHFRRR